MNGHLGRNSSQFNIDPGPPQAEKSQMLLLWKATYNAKQLQDLSVLSVLRKTQNKTGNDFTQEGTLHVDPEDHSNTSCTAI